jgi:hypothetical protein
MRCQFSRDNSDDEDVSFDGQVVFMNDIFWYLGSMLQSDRRIDEDKHMIFSMTRRSQIN